MPTRQRRASIESTRWPVAVTPATLHVHCRPSSNRVTRKSSHGPTGGRICPWLPGPRKRPSWRTSLIEGPHCVHVVVSISTRHTCAAGAWTTRETHIAATVPAGPPGSGPDPRR